LSYDPLRFSPLFPRFVSEHRFMRRIHTSLHEVWSFRTPPPAHQPPKPPGPLFREDESDQPPKRPRRLARLYQPTPDFQVGEWEGRDAGSSLPRFLRQGLSCGFSLDPSAEAPLRLAPTRLECPQQPASECPPLDPPRRLAGFFGSSISSKGHGSGFAPECPECPRVPKGALDRVPLLGPPNPTLENPST
jgi:hypothetical protein